MPLRILLIDDDDDDQFIFMTALEDVAPFSRCRITGNAAEAFEELNNEVPDIMFLDLNMPLMNGFEFLLILKSDPRFSGIPVVIYSTSDSPGDQNRAKELGAIQFITKTADIQLLKQDLQNIINASPVTEAAFMR
jgi:CheY-like chemotaxis protein